MSLYRPNVAALLVNGRGKVLVCERSNVRGAWQFPQGGIDEGEDVLTALKREIAEEVGLLPEHYDVLDQRSGYRYEYPEKVLKKKKRHFIGQEQTYFLCKVHNDAPEINIDQDPKEFRDYKWIEPQKFSPSWLPDFKKATYRQVFIDFFGVEISED